MTDSVQTSSWTIGHLEGLRYTAITQQHTVIMIARKCFISNIYGNLPQRRVLCCFSNVIFDGQVLINIESETALDKMLPNTAIRFYVGE